MYLVVFCQCHKEDSMPSKWTSSLQNMFFLDTAAYSAQRLRTV